ncbi:MAG: phosphoenolpyruvate carboxykinase (ATP) [Bryobacterales bacterium]|nr:phosphoenolpyruvate carboxykinase (ATP) [Bryobacterales bacterium]
MQNAGIHPSRYGLEQHGIRNANTIFWNLGTAQLVEAAIQRREGLLASGGAFVVRTGNQTGRSPQDKFTVRDAMTEDAVAWGPVNQPFTPENFDRLYDKLIAYLQARDLFVQDCFAGADTRYRLPIRIISERAWHNLFARQLFVRPDWLRTEDHVPEFTVIDAPGFRANPAEDGTNSVVFIIVNFTRKLIIIGGTAYAGEIKKSIFSVLNYRLPEVDVLPMHCSANIGSGGDCALFFGLSGTGKTTLSADRERRLIGDDEHGWGPDGVFNFEGGCYAKTIRLSRETEPQIWDALRFGSVLENVAVDTELRLLNFDDDTYTENTRAAYPVTFIDNAIVPGIGPHPKNIIFLTADAFGVMPPIARLDSPQAMYHFLSGYTAKVAGTERGLGKDPEATFSSCFGAPFLPRNPRVYADMLGKMMGRHQANCWLVNTGWSGGSFGVGRRMDLPVTRSIVRAALSGSLANAEYRTDATFGFAVPVACPGVDPSVLHPRGTWADGEAYDRAAADLAARFHRNFEKFNIDGPIKSAGPR